MVGDEELELRQGMESSCLAEDMVEVVKRKEEINSEASQPGHWICARGSLQHWEQNRGNKCRLHKLAQYQRGRRVWRHYRINRWSRRGKGKKAGRTLTTEAKVPS